MDDTECANPQLLGWVKEWVDFAREKNTKGFTTYQNAYKSLKACPIIFQHPAQLQQLKGFGPKLCDRLTDKLRTHCQQNGLTMPEHPQARKAAARDTGNGEEDSDAGPSRKKTRKPKAYVPAFRSGAYALVVALSTQSEDSTQGMTKTELIELAQPHCDSSFSVPSDSTKFYTAWNSMKTLITKELVYERGRPLKRYGLTDEGWDVAKRVKETRESLGEETAPRQSALGGSAIDLENDEQEEPAEHPRVSTSMYQDVVADGSAITGTDSLPTFTPIRLPPGSFTVELLLDVREVRAKTDRDYIQQELAKQGVNAVMRSLEVGDAQWIARVRDPSSLAAHGAEGDEIVLDWIVERKRLDDLIGSIKDGRFHEQKFRLKRSGVKKVIYLIEDFSIDQQVLQRYEEAVQSAIASTQVVNGYFVKRTSKMDESIKYLARMTKMLQKSYEKRTLHVIPTKILTAQNYRPLLDHLAAKEPDLGYYITYPAFSSLASKSDSITLRDVFLKMLMTTKGVTGERALEIQKRWKTPHEFVKAFEACGEGEAGKKRKMELVLGRTVQLTGRKKFSKQLSQKISEIWGDT